MLTRRERGATFCLVLALVAVCFLWGRTAGASAAPVPTFADACGSANNFDYAVCERLDYIAAEQSVIDSEQAGSIERLDLVWIGVWFSGGVLLGVTFAQKIWAEVRKWHGAWR